jgi:hypothetical protein
MHEIFLILVFGIAFQVFGIQLIYHLHIKPLEANISTITEDLAKANAALSASEHFFAAVALPEETIYGEMPDTRFDTSISQDIENLFTGDYTADWTEIENIKKRGSETLASKL